MRNKIAHWIYLNLGDDLFRDGSMHPPGVVQRFEFGEPDPDTGELPYLATTYNNDGFELWLYWAGRWAAFYKAKEARKLAWFILWTWWAKGTWFGVKRKIWYWALHIKCERSKTLPKK